MSRGPLVGQPDLFGKEPIQRFRHGDRVMQTLVVPFGDEQVTRNRRGTIHASSVGNGRVIYKLKWDTDTKFDFIADEDLEPEGSS